MVKVLGRIFPDRIKNAIFHLSYHLAHAEFDKFAYEYDFAPNMYLGLAAMAARGFSPRTIVDAGVFEGNWSRLAKRIWPSGRLVMIEPNLEKKDRLLRVAKDLDANLVCELLGAENGQ